MQRMIKFATVAVLGQSILAANAFADTPEHFCAFYARSAVHQGEAARAVGSCRHLVAETPQRWSLNYDQHFAYCMRIYGSGAGMAEDKTRAHELRQCESH